MDASFEEKSVWITLISLAIGFAVYFSVAARMLSAGITDSAVPYVPIFILAVIAQVVVIALGHIAAVLVARPEGRDERDRLIEWRSEHHSSWLLGFGVVGAMFALATPIGRAWVANWLLMFMFLSEMLAQGLRLWFYRRGI